jgi:hypothetical protein
MPFMTEVQTMADDRVASNDIDAYFELAAPSLDCHQQVKVTAAVMELLRLVSGAAVVANGSPQAARLGLIDLIGHLFGVDWEKVPFSITRAALSVKDPQCDVLTALKTFANIVQADPTLGTQEVFESLLAPPPPPPKTMAKQAPALAPGKTLLETCIPAKFSPDGSPACELLSWQSHYEDGSLGPQLAAVCLDRGEQCKVLLETGEIVFLPNDTFLLSQTVDANDYAMTPPHLLACLRAIAPLQWVAYPPVEDSVFDARFGQFTQPVVFCPYGEGAIKWLVENFENMAVLNCGNTIATTLTVDGTPYSVTLETRVSHSRACVTAKLLDCNENVVMRLDTPRQFSPRGVYLFPLPDIVIALVVQ